MEVTPPPQLTSPIGVGGVGGDGVGSSACNGVAVTVVPGTTTLVGSAVAAGTPGVLSGSEIDRGVSVGVGVGVIVGVLVGVGVSVGVAVGVLVGVLVAVGVCVGVFVGVDVGVFVAVLVGVAVGVFVGVLVAVSVGVAVAVAVRWLVAKMLSGRPGLKESSRLPSATTTRPATSNLLNSLTIDSSHEGSKPDAASHP